MTHFFHYLSLLISKQLRPQRKRKHPNRRLQRSLNPSKYAFVFTFYIYSIICNEWNFDFNLLNKFIIEISFTHSSFRCMIPWTDWTQMTPAPNLTTYSSSGNTYLKVFFTKNKIHLFMCYYRYISTNWWGYCSRRNPCCNEVLGRW